MDTKTIRSSNFELLRIFAMMLIVACHYSFHGINDGILLNVDNVSTFNKLFAAFLIPGGAIGNGIFFSLTGFFLCKADFDYNRIVKLLCQVCFYSILMLAIFIAFKLLHLYSFPATHKNGQLMFLIKGVLPITGGNWWFVQTYFFLFLLFPVINLIISKINENRLPVLLFIIWLFWYMPTIFNFTYSNLQLAIFFYLLGAVIRLNEINTNKLLMFLIFSFCWLCTSTVVYYGSSYTTESEIKLKIMELLVKTVSTFFTTFSVISVFLFFKNLNINNSVLINKIAKTTLGIYLIHDSHIFRDIMWNKILHVSDIQFPSPFFPIWAVLTILCVFFVCSFADFIRIKLFSIIIGSKSSNITKSN